MKTIKLNSGENTIVDDEDFEYLNKFNWALNKDGYAYRSTHLNMKRVVYWMHRVILPPDLGREIDHINGDRLDNRRSNLRLVTRLQNVVNSMRKGQASGYKGVTWYKPLKKWKARIKLAGKEKHLGYFLEPKEGARAYNQAALERFGEYARLNEI